MIKTSPSVATGLSAIPDAWIPQGDTEAYVSSPWGSDYATISRGQSSAEIDCHTRFSPDVEIDDLGGGRVKIFVDMPWPLGNITAVGPMEQRGDAVHFDDERSSRTADMWQLWDGRIHMAVHEPGKDDIDLFVQKV